MEDNEGWINVKPKKKPTDKKPNPEKTIEPKKILLNNYQSEFVIKGEKTTRVDKDFVVKKNKQPNQNVNSVNVNAKKIELQAEEGDFHINLINHDLKLEIQKARMNKKWTQKELALKCNLPTNVIQAYEQGNIVPNSAHLVKMSQVLDVKLSNKKKN
jgi:ribosome-binding protein aMBF1 (putative translation factor)